MSGQWLDRAKLIASAELRKLHGAKKKHYTVKNFPECRVYIIAFWSKNN